MVKNLLQTGTPFNYSSDDANYSDDLLNLDIADDLEVFEDDKDMGFEDER